jgi:Na+-driven multidrug efflux pump/anti-sigma regulatory factor (Ser/Thr protein kinase)
MNHNLTDYRLLTRQFFRLLPYQILLIVLSTVNDIFSSLFASNYIGTDAMSALGLYSPFDAFIIAISLMFIIGSEILCGKFMGKHEIERTGKVFSVDLLMSIVFSIATILFLVLVTIFDWSRVLTPDAAVRASLNRYIMGSVIGIFPTIIGQQFTAFLSLENKTRITTFASVAFLGVTLILDYLFVAVYRMGEFGLALAPSVGMWVFMLIEIQHYFSKNALFKPSLTGLKLRDAWQIVKTGFSGAVIDEYQAALGFILNILIVMYVGSAGLSAYAATQSMMLVVGTVSFGMIQVGRMLMSVSIGEEDRKTLVDVMRVGLCRCIPIITLIAALMIGFAVPLTRLFYRDPADPVYELTVTGFRILPLYIPLSVFRMQFSCYAQSSGKEVLSNILALLEGIVCMAFFSAILIRPMGMNGVYWSYPLTGVVCAIVIVLYSVIMRGSFPKKLEQLMVIPDDFGAPEDARIDISVQSIDEVIMVSRQVIDFCRNRGIDRRTAFFSGLFLEEMAGNVVEHGFTKDRKPHSVDIRVVHKEDNVILRIKDDCIPFDPEERVEILDPSDPVKGAGIRLVYKMAKDIKYQNMLGLNVLTIHILAG